MLSANNNSGETDVLAIVGAIVGLYGAVLSTYNAWKAHRRDRVEIRLHVAPHMTVANNSLREGMTFTIVSATNVGSRPITITHVVLHRLDSDVHGLLTDTVPPLPCPLTEGQYMTAFLDEVNMGDRPIESWYVVDSAGREHHLYVAPWYRRMLSKHRRRKEWTARKKAKKASPPPAA